MKTIQKLSIHYSWFLTRSLLNFLINHILHLLNLFIYLNLHRYLYLRHILRYWLYLPRLNEWRYHFDKPFCHVFLKAAIVQDCAFIFKSHSILKEDCVGKVKSLFSIVILIHEMVNLEGSFLLSQDTFYEETLKLVDIEKAHFRWLPSHRKSYSFIG